MSRISELIFNGAYDTNHYITSSYGPRTYWYNGKWVSDFHNGVDYGTHNQKIPQYAIEDGYIVSEGIDSSGAVFCWVAYPRIGKKFLHYHLNDTVINKGDKVVRGTLLGHTGMTGQSTGIHLHLGVYDINSTSIFSGYEDPEAFVYTEPSVEPTKSIDEIANEVIAGKWGNGNDRIVALEAAGYNYAEVQKRVNELVNQPAPAPSVDLLDLVRKTMRGDFGNGQDRINALGSNYDEVQRQINLNLQNGTTQWDSIKLY